MQDQKNWQHDSLIELFVNEVWTDAFVGAWKRVEKDNKILWNSGLTKISVICYPLFSFPLIYYKRTTHILFQDSCSSLLSSCIFKIFFRSTFFQQMRLLIPFRKVNSSPPSRLIDAHIFNVRFNQRIFCAHNWKLS